MVDHSQHNWHRLIEILTFWGTSHVPVLHVPHSLKDPEGVRLGTTLLHLGAVDAR